MIYLAKIKIKAEHVDLKGKPIDWNDPKVKDIINNTVTKILIKMANSKEVII